MKHLKLYESIDSTWREDIISLYDIFCGLDDLKICRLDYQAGYRSSNGNTSYPCFLKNEKIEGGEEHIDYMIKINSKPLLRVSLVEIIYKNNSPFKQTHTPSFYAEDADTFLTIMKYVDSAKKKMIKYNLGITLDENVIYLDFLQKS